MVAGDPSVGGRAEPDPGPARRRRSGSAAPGARGGRVRSARREATRERLLDAAREVFAERGVFGGTVEDICDRAGFTRGAFYSNFEDKDDVLRALIEREHARLLAHLEPSFALLDPAAVATDDLAATMADLADRLLRSVPADRLFSLIQTEIEIHAVRNPETSRAFEEADARFRARIADLLDRGLRLLDREPVVDLDAVTDAVIAIVERSTRRALLEGAGADPNALAAVMLPPLIFGASRPRR